MSMLSLAPATTTDGWLASIATAGSFCLFCENGDTGLPTVTSVPVAGGSVTGSATAVPAIASTMNNDVPAAANLSVRIGPHPPALSCAGPCVPALSVCVPQVPSLDPNGRFRQECHSLVTNVGHCGQPRGSWERRGRCQPVTVTAQTGRDHPAMGPVLDGPGRPR